MLTAADNRYVNLTRATCLALKHAQCAHQRQLPDRSHVHVVSGLAERLAQ